MVALSSMEPLPTTLPEEDTSLQDFLRAAKPDWSRKTKTLESVEDKLNKVGIFDVPALIIAIKGKNNINKKLCEIGEKGFAQETLSLLRRCGKKYEGGESMGSNAQSSDSVGFSFAMPVGSSGYPPEETVELEYSPSTDSPTQPRSKDAMTHELRKLGIEVLPSCQARELLAMVSEVRKLQRMKFDEILTECAARSLPYSMAKDRSALVQNLILADFPLKCTVADAAQLVPPLACDNDGQVVATSGNVARVLDFSDPPPPRLVGSPPVATVAPRGGSGEPKSPLSLESLLEGSREELLSRCRSRGIEVKESDHKGMLAFLLKVDHSKELMKQLQESDGSWV